MLLAIALILDHWFKLQFIEFAYEKIYGEYANGYVRHFKYKINALFDEYVQKSYLVGTSFFQPSSIAMEYRKMNAGSKKTLIEVYIFFISFIR